MSAHPQGQIQKFLFTFSCFLCNKCSQVQPSQESYGLLKKKKDVIYCLKTVVELTPELLQHGFELCGSTYIQIISNSYVPPCYLICLWLKLWLQNHRQELIKFTRIFNYAGVCASIPYIFKSQLCLLFPTFFCLISTSHTWCVQYYTKLYCHHKIF